jgi:hypothetical protein
MAIKRPATDASEICLRFRAGGKSGSRGCAGRGVLTRAVWIADVSLQAYFLNSIIGFAPPNVVLARDFFSRRAPRRRLVSV